MVIVGFIFVNCENFDSENPKSYSQIGQDLKVLKHFNNKKYGYFIEVGANDGKTLSNTYIFGKKIIIGMAYVLSRCLQSITN